MVMREIEETSYNYNCLREKKKGKKEYRKNEINRKTMKTICDLILDVRFYQIYTSISFSYF